MAARTIFLGPPEDLGDVYEETRAAGTIKPGHILDYDAAGKVVVHGTAGGAAPGVVALEDGLVGKTVDDAYASGDLVRNHVGRGGQKYYLRVAAAAVAILRTDFLASAGDGTVKKAAGGDVKLYKPLDALDNSAGGADAWIRAQKI